MKFLERMSMIETIPGWEKVRELQAIHKWHAKCVRAMQCIEGEAGTDDLASVIKQMFGDGEKQFSRMVKCLPKLCADRKGEFSSDFADTFLTTFYQNWINSTSLLSHYVACCNRDGTFSASGIIDPELDVADACSKVAKEAKHICDHVTGRSPVIEVDVQTCDASDAVVASIPKVLRYVLLEVLKNSCQATLKASEKNGVLKHRPVKVVVSADESQVMININDEAGGIPDEVAKKVWSYMYTTSRSRASALCGHGVGLPFARLYAQTLGGSLDLWSTPGFGTHARICLPRLQADDLPVNPLALESSRHMQTSYASTTATTHGFL
jgi:light-regulated signal transduction histidine kinase (bacteriophytochrome)